MLNERAVEISQTYRPKRARPRTVTVERIPAVELTADGDSEIGIEGDVCERIQVLIERALGANDVIDQRITYTPADLDVVSSRRRISSPSGHRRGLQT